jgi:hypothetical protein
LIEAVCQDALDETASRNMPAADSCTGDARAASNYWGFVLLDEAKAFFTAVENFAQLQDSSESSPQRVAFDLSTGRFAAVAGKLVGDNTIGGPTG